MQWHCYGRGQAGKLRRRRTPCCTAHTCRVPTAAAAAVCPVPLQVEEGIDALYDLIWHIESYEQVGTSSASFKRSAEGGDACLGCAPVLGGHVECNYCGLLLLPCW